MTTNATELELSDKDRALLAGDMGPAARMAMSILVRMARIVQADRMMDITQAHIDSTIYVGDAGLDFAERLASLGAKVAVPTSLNVSSLDEHHWKDTNVARSWAEKAYRQMKAYESMGTVPTWTCAPYQTELRPAFGQQIAWGESNAIVFANSVIGARTDCYPDFLDTCAAITARVPATGLHLDENRAARIVFDLSLLPNQLAERHDFYPVLGHLVGKLSGDRVPAIVGLQHTPTEDQLKAFGAAVSSSGRIGLFHIVGVTPEAATLDMALRGRAPRQTLELNMAQLREARRELTTATGKKLDLVVLGSPHFSFEEFRELAPLLRGKKRHPDVQFLVTTSRVVRDLARAAGFMSALEEFGGQVTVDTCILATPMLADSVQTLMTNSGKYAFYSPGLLGTEVTFGSLSDCIASAIEGSVRRDEGPWAEHEKP